MKYLSIDIESFSSINLAKSGVYRYTQENDFEILLFGYSVDGGEAHVVDLAQGEQIPQPIIDALGDDSIIKWAFNANFERVCLSHFLGLPQGQYLSPRSWRCTMIWSAYLGLPLSLQSVGSVLGLEEQKLSEGKELIRYFCNPCSPTRTNGGRIRNHPTDGPDRWDRFVSYNRRDVEVELTIQKKLSRFPIPEAIWEEYHLDQTINDRGVLVDMPLVQQAIAMDERSREQLLTRMQELTDLENPNSVAQLKVWLSEQGLEIASLGKRDVQAALAANPSAKIEEVLQLRLQLAKTSIRKYQAIEQAVCSDKRVRGMFQFYGANRTGRWSGRLVQLQNLRQNRLEDLKTARALVKSGEYKAVAMLYSDVPDTLSQLIRTAFIPKEGHKFIVSDFSAIEARVLSWLAGESWRMEVFAKNGDIYCETASRMFQVPVDRDGENSHLRQKGKQAELACIAEGQLVLTDTGLVPIECVAVQHKLWDGESWVDHEGVIYQGKKEVITYEGLSATADHLVWIEGQQEPVPLGLAAIKGAALMQTGEAEKALPFNTAISTPSNNPEPMRALANVYDILNAGPHHRFTVSNCLVHNCGYGGSVGALKAMGAIESGMAEEELKPLVDAWRQSNPNIVKLWWDVDRAMKQAVREKTSTITRGIRFSYESGFVFITLPSGRRLAYVKPRIGTSKFGNPCVTYEGIGTARRWERMDTYGPKIVENIVQAISRDLLAYAMKNLQREAICMHIHDEIVIEAPAETSLDDITTAMGTPPSWAKGLTLDAEGFETTFYKKD